MGTFFFESSCLSVTLRHCWNECISILAPSSRGWAKICPVLTSDQAILCRVRPSLCSVQCGGYITCSPDVFHCPLSLSLDHSVAGVTGGSGDGSPSPIHRHGERKGGGECFSSTAGQLLPALCAPRGPAPGCHSDSALFYLSLSPFFLSLSSPRLLYPVVMVIAAATVVLVCPLHH